MYKWMISITFALLLSQAAAAGNCSLQATESRLQNKDPQVLMEVEQQWLQAYGERNTRALDCILAAVPRRPARLATSRRVTRILRDEHGVYTKTRARVFPWSDRPFTRLVFSD
jgi:hypothetical protein